MRTEGPIAVVGSASIAEGLPVFARFATRDLIVVAVSAGVWWLAAGRSAQSGALADFSGFVAGSLLGLSAFALHEWGHLLAAFAARSAVAPNRNLGSLFIFRFDAKRNSLGQFLVMSLGGFIVTGAVVWGAYTQLPDAYLAARVARGAALFLAFLGVTLELPLVALALYTRAVPAAVALKPPRGGEGAGA
jgi:hypothetical protein